jgi:hypothetical protein
MQDELEQNKAAEDEALKNYSAGEAKINQKYQTECNRKK